MTCLFPKNTSDKIFIMSKSSIVEKNLPAVGQIPRQKSRPRPLQGLDSFSKTKEKCEGYGLQPMNTTSDRPTFTQMAKTFPIQNNILSKQALTAGGQPQILEIAGQDGAKSKGEKSTKMKNNHHQEAPDIRGELKLQKVNFVFTHSTATTVSVAGTFNNWRPETEPMRPSGNNCWMDQTELAPGRYEYCLVVDGKYEPDPLAAETVPNPYGGRNSVLTVFPSPEVAHLAEAEHLPMKTIKNKTRLS
jgi:hypothetical protein